MINTPTSDTKTFTVNTNRGFILYNTKSKELISVHANEEPTLFTYPVSYCIGRESNINYSLLTTTEYYDEILRNDDYVFIGDLH